MKTINTHCVDKNYSSTLVTGMSEGKYTLLCIKCTTCGELVLWEDKDKECPGMPTHVFERSIITRDRENYYCSYIDSFKCVQCKKIMPYAELEKKCDGFLRKVKT
jgi:hypothetical protein